MAARVSSSPFWQKPVDVSNEDEVAELRRRNAARSRRWRVSYGEDGLAQNSGYYHKPRQPKSRTLVAHDGSTYSTPDEIDWDDWLDIFKAQHGSKMTEEYASTLKRGSVRSLADLCHWAFDRKESNFDSVECKEGHIARIDYHNGSKTMRVHFRNRGDVVCYFYVPANVYMTLRALGQSMATRIGYGGKMRHLVGIYFWDLVRVRGTLFGNRYECCYVTNDGGGYVKASPDEARGRASRDAGEMSSVESKLRSDGQAAAAGELKKSSPAEDKWKQMAGKGLLARAAEVLRRDAARLLEEQGGNHE